MPDLYSLDPGRKNIFFEASSAGEYFSEYTQNLARAAGTVDPKALDQMMSAVREAADRKSKIFVAGNGGSAAIADHLCCDFSKGTFHPGHAPVRTHSLSANGALYSALANDFGFENAFSASLDIFSDPKDVLIAISSSGNSPNILFAVDRAKEIGMTTIGLSGFSGGKLKDSADISLHVNFANYGIVEDCHQMIMHSVAQFLIIQRSR